MMRHSLPYLVMLLAVVLLAGYRAEGRTLSANQLQDFGIEMMDIEWLKKPAQWKDHEIKLTASLNSARSSNEQARFAFLLGYYYEFRETLMPKDPKRRSYANAQQYYTRAMKTDSPYGLQAAYRLGVLGGLGKLGGNSRKIAQDAFGRLVKQSGQQLWVRQTMPTKTPPAPLSPVELAGAKAPGGGDRAILVTSPTAAIEEGPVLQAHDMAAIAKVRLATLSKSK